MTQPAVVFLWIVSGFSLFAILTVFRRIRQGMKDLDTLERVLSQPDQPWDTIRNTELLSIWVRDRFVRLSALFDQAERPDILVLREESDAQFDNDLFNRFLQFSSSSLLIIGLCGTFIASRGIIMHSGLDTVVAGEAIDMARFRESIDAIYAGFGGAFFASILGIAATIVVSACSVAIQKTWKGFLERFDRLTSTVILPRYSRRDRTDAGELRDAAVAIRDASTRLDSATSDIAGKGQDFAGNMDATVRRMADAAEVLETVTAEESPLLQTLAAIALLQKRFLEERDRLDGHLTNLITQIQTLVGTVAGAQGEFVQLNGALAGLHTEFPTTITGITTAYQNSVKQLVDRSIDFIRDESGKVDAQRSETQRLLQATQALLGRIQSTQDTIESRMQAPIRDLEHATRNLEGAINQIPAAIQSGVSQVKFPPVMIPPVQVPPVTIPPITLPPVQLPTEVMADLRRMSDGADQLAAAAGKLDRVTERLDRLARSIQSPPVNPSPVNRRGVLSWLFGLIGRRGVQ